MIEYAHNNIIKKTGSKSLRALCLALALMPGFRTEAQTPQNIRLEQLEIMQVQTGYGRVGHNVSADGNPLTISGQKLAHGLGVHAPSLAFVALNGAQTFSTQVGLDDEVLGKAGSVEFIISADGKTLWKSGLMRAGDKPKAVNLNVRGYKVLKLEVTDGGDGKNSDHANWGEAVFTYTGAAPQMARDPGQIWIEAGTVRLVLQVDADKRLSQLHFGSNASQPADSVGEAYEPFGERSLLEPALRVTHADGNTSTQLEFVSQSTQKLDANVTQTRIELKDPNYPFWVSLFYKAYARESVLEQWTEIRHQESGPVKLDQFASAAPSFSTDPYFLTQFRGDWNDEMNREEERCGYGLKILSSRGGIRTTRNLSPSFLLSRGAPSQQNAGEVIGGTLAYSGNFQFQFEVDPQRRLRAICGINPEASQYRLPANQPFVTPPLIWSVSTQGRGELGRQFARWGRQYGMREGQKARDVMLNNWEATYFGFNEQKLLGFFDSAKDLGMEIFLLDDGWFGNKYPRDWEGQGLGDWQPMTRKLPRGLSFLTEEAKKRGLRFGLWIEPEMVNPQSELYQKHPDWVVRQPGRKLHLWRHQLVLDLSNPQVREWMFQTLDTILTQNPGISYLKWDCNRSINQPGSTYLKADEQSHFFIEYNRGYYEVLERLVKKHPNVQLMNCASGGGRVDYGSLRLAQEVWPSDNTDPLRRVRMQWNYQQFFPNSALASHVTHMGNRPLKFAFDVAMSARLGMDMDTSKLSVEDKIFARNAVATYKGFRDIIQLGDIYHLESPYDGARVSQLFASPDKSRAVVFAWQTRTGQVAKLPLQGLDKAKRYQIREVNLKAGQPSQIKENGQVLDGATLEKNGLTLPLKNQFDSAIIELTSAR